MSERLMVCEREKMTLSASELMGCWYCSVSSGLVGAAGLGSGRVDYGERGQGISGCRIYCATAALLLNTIFSKPGDFRDHCRQLQSDPSTPLIQSATSVSEIFSPSSSLRLLSLGILQP